MKTVINQSELNDYLNASFNKDSLVHPWENLLSFCLYKTGLRVEECIQCADRWVFAATAPLFTLQVALSKGEAFRNIEIQNDDLPYFNQFYLIRNYMFGTYSSYNHWLRKRIPIITVNSDVRRTTSHLFRYNFIKKLHEDGYTDVQIKNEIVHASQGSTDRYIYDLLYLNT